MAVSVTVPSGTTATATLQYNNSFNNALANAISGALGATQATAPGSLNIVTVSGSAPVTVGAAVGGDVNEVFIAPDFTGGVVSVPAGWQYVVDTSPNADTIFGSPGISIMGGSGNHTIVDPDLITLGDSTGGSSGNQVLSVTGASDNAAVGNGTNTLTGTGGGTLSGGSGKNTFLLSGATGVYTVNSIGQGDSVQGGAESVFVNALALGPVTTPGSTIPGATSKGGVFRAGAGGIVVNDSGGKAETILGGVGGATVTASGGAATIIGGAGNLDVVASAPFVQVNLGSGTGTMATSVSGSNNAIVLGDAGGTVSLASGASTAFVFGGGSETAAGAVINVVDFGTADEIVAANTVASSNVTLAGSNGDEFAVGGTVGASLAGTNNQVFANFGGTPVLAVTISGTKDVAVGGQGGGNVTITSGSTGDIVAPIQTTAAVMNVLDGGTKNQILGGYASAGTLNVTLTGSGDTIAAGSAATNVTVSGAGAATVFNLGGSLSFVGGSGTASVEAFNFTGKGGTTTVTGGSGGSITFTNSGFGTGALTYHAGAGNETLNAAGSTSNDTLAAGAGNATLTAGTGSTEFLLSKTLIEGAGTVGGGTANEITNFTVNGSNTVQIQGYVSGSGSVAAAGAGSTLTLSDGTKITFDNTGTATLTNAIHYS